MPNPAKTLWQHFVELQKHVSANATTSWPQAWEAVIGMPWQDAAGPLLGLIDQSRNIIAAQPDMELPRLFFYEQQWRWAILLPGIKHDAQISQSGYMLDDAPVNGLYSVAMTIQGLPSTPELAEQQIEQLARAVQSLCEDVLAADQIDLDLRQFLLHQVTMMEARIKLHRVTGSGPIEALVTETIGSAATHASMWDQALKSSLKTKIIAVFVALNAISGFINTTTQAVQSTDQAIHTVTTVAEEILRDPPKQIEAPSQAPPALPPGPTGTVSADSN